jgi:hypothetical protein
MTHVLQFLRGILFDFLAVYWGVENFVTLLYHDIPNLVI